MVAVIAVIVLVVTFVWAEFGGKSDALVKEAAREDPVMQTVGCVDGVARVFLIIVVIIFVVGLLLPVLMGGG